MRAAIFRNGDFVVDDIKDPTPSEGQVLVKSLCCGICGSDLHAAKYTPEFVDRSRRSGNRWAMDPERDVVFGHEFCCEVVDHGPGTDTEGQQHLGSRQPRLPRLRDYLLPAEALGNVGIEDETDPDRSIASRAIALHEPLNFVAARGCARRTRRRRDRGWQTLHRSEQADRPGRCTGPCHSVEWHAAARTDHRGSG
jgi:hypothetical protein